MPAQGALMRGVNKVIIIGTLGADPEVRYTADGKCVASMSLATNDGYKDKNTGEQKQVTEWHRVILWERIGEIAGEYLRKGSTCYIEGKLKTRKWTDQGGIERYTTEVVAEKLQLLGGDNQKQSSNGQANQAQQAGAAVNSQAVNQTGRKAPPPQGYTGMMGQAPSRAFNQPANQQFNQGGMMEPPIDFDDDIPF